MKTKHNDSINFDGHRNFGLTKGAYDSWKEQCEYMLSVMLENECALTSWEVWT